MVKRQAEEVGKRAPDKLRAQKNPQAQDARATKQARLETKKQEGTQVKIRLITFSTKRWTHESSE